MLKILWTNNEHAFHHDSSQFMELSHMHFHEQVMTQIEAYQVRNNASQFMKISLMNSFEQAMNRIKIYQVHTNLSHELTWKVHKLNCSLISIVYHVFDEQVFMNWLDEALMNVHKHQRSSLVELHSRGKPKLDNCLADDADKINSWLNTYLILIYKLSDLPLHHISWFI